MYQSNPTSKGLWLKDFMQNKKPLMYELFQLLHSSWNK